jgi:hypothetical protein
MFLIIQFEDESVEVIPSCGVESEEDPNIGSIIAIALPPKEIFIRKLVPQKCITQSTWLTYQVTVLYKNGKFL